MGSDSIGKFKLGRLGDEWCVTWNEGGKRRRFRLGQGTAEEARGKLASFVAKHNRLTAEHATTVQGIFDSYMADREAQGKKPGNMHWTWKMLAPHFGSLKVTEKWVDTKGSDERMFIGLTLDISGEHCRAYMRHRTERGKKPGTILTEMTLLQTICNWAKKQGTIQHAPVIEKPSAPPPKDRWLTHEEAQALIDGAVMPHVRLFIVLGLATAGRHEALLDLTWDRVDFELGRIDLRDPTKGATPKGRAVVPMVDMARAALQEARAGARSAHVIEYAGERVKKIRKGFENAVERAGLSDDVTPHVLRHTAAVWMAQAGVPMSQISQYLGHTSTAVTEKVYARYSPSFLADAGKALNLKPARLVPLRKVG